MYKIAKTKDDLSSFRTYTENFICSYGHYLRSCEIGFYSNNAVKTHTSQTVELVPPLVEGGATSSAVTRIRIGKDDSDQTQGGIVEVYVDTSSPLPLVTNISNNTGRDLGEGWELLEPVISDGLLPGGNTATFLEAGEELSLPVETVDVLKGKKLTNDIVSVTVKWPEIPKQGTILTLTLPSTALTFRDGTASSAVITGAHTISSFSITGKLINFRINEVGLFTSLNAGPLGSIFTGTGGKLTIT